MCSQILIVLYKCTLIHIHLHHMNTYVLSVNVSTCFFWHFCCTCTHTNTHTQCLAYILLMKMRWRCPKLYSLSWNDFLFQLFKPITNWVKNFWVNKKNKKIDTRLLSTDDEDVINRHAVVYMYSYSYVVIYMFLFLFSTSLSYNTWP